MDTEGTQRTEARRRVLQELQQETRLHDNEYWVRTQWERLLGDLVVMPQNRQRDRGDDS